MTCVFQNSRVDLMRRRHGVGGEAKAGAAAATDLVVYKSSRLVLIARERRWMPVWRVTPAPRSGHTNFFVQEEEFLSRGITFAHCDHHARQCGHRRLTIATLFVLVLQEAPPAVEMLTPPLKKLKR